jgi:DNA-binding response OmpR family regulator
MKKTILLIEGSDRVRGYLIKKLREQGFEAQEAKTGFDGLIKLKNNPPDLVITEYDLVRVSVAELLEEKSKTKNAADVPVIMLSAEVDRGKIRAVAKHKIARFLVKPLRIDTLMKAISEVLGTEYSLDATPCTIDVHINEQILFIELAQGLNSEKIELMGHRIVEILDLYGMKTPRILVIMTGIDLNEGDSVKLMAFFRTILEETGTPTKAIKVLTTSDYVARFLSKEERFAGIGISPSFTQAMDELLGIKVSDFIPTGFRIVRDDMLSARGATSGSLDLRFEGDRGATIAVVDDDLVTRELVTTAFAGSGCEVVPYEDGKRFVDELAERKPDLVFLDLVMPVMDGFAVLSHLKSIQQKVPVIILSALSERETVVKAMSYGIKSYLAKPLTPVEILQKAAEILKREF